MVTATQEQINAVKTLIDRGISGKGIIQKRLLGNEWTDSELLCLNEIEPKTLSALIWFPKEVQIEDTKEQKILRMYELAEANADSVDFFPANENDPYLSEQKAICDTIEKVLDILGIKIRGINKYDE